MYFCATFRIKNGSRFVSSFIVAFFQHNLDVVVAVVVVVVVLVWQCLAKPLSCRSEIFILLNKK